MMRTNIQFNRRATLLSALALTTLLLNGCDFHLRGDESMPAEYRSLQVIVPTETPKDLWKKAPLDTAIRAELMVFKVALDQPNTVRLHVLDIRPNHQETTGAVYEIGDSLDVDFRMEDAQGQPLTATRTASAHRSFQYNINSVGIPSQQEEPLKAALYQDVAGQIVRQLATGRLPAAS